MSSLNSRNKKLSDNSKIGKLGKCNTCGQEKQIYSEIFTGEQFHRYCKECHDNLHKIIKCKKCGEEMQNQYYYKHLSDMHSD